MDALKKYAGALGIVILVVALASAFYWLVKLATEGTTVAMEVRLPLLAIGGVVVLLLVLAIVVVVFATLGLSDSNQALGLPEGSIRAVIALSLVVLFGILSVYLYQGIANAPLHAVELLSEAERAQFVKDHASALDLRVTPAQDEQGKPRRAADGSLYYSATYRASSPSADEFAKQLLVLLGTLMTAVTSFYLGARTATTPAKNAPAPAVTDANPPKFSLAAGSTIKLRLTGTDLSSIVNVRAVKPGSSEQIVATAVQAFPTSVTCELPVTPSTPQGTWDLTVDDGASRSVTLKGQFTIEA